MNINLLQYNCRKSTAVWDDLRKRGELADFDIIATQEPPVDRTKQVLSITGSITIQPSGQQRPLVGIHISEELDAVKIDVGREWCIVAHISGRGRKFVLINAYLAPSEDIEPKLADLGEVLGRCRPADVVLCMDANARSDAWHSRIRNARGRALEAFLDTHSMTIINVDTGDMTTFAGESGCSGNIDITAASGLIFPKIANWRLEDWYVSDHKAILFEIIAKYTRTTRTQPGNRIKKLDEG
ncbi:UNVERIFIED_CONTAM: hypothetical protein PYX00_008768 [Menopon gallinae]|uniref:Endonuclease/exonuclease/phosphatase domain-containing protein n=1 Tax=Menopon gallinae TaxID=328185 RepID=A0AAW2HPB1_9NEOP